MLISGKLQLPKLIYLHSNQNKSMWDFFYKPFSKINLHSIFFMKTNSWRNKAFTNAKFVRLKDFEKNIAYSIELVCT